MYGMGSLYQTCAILSDKVVEDPHVSYSPSPEAKKIREQYKEIMLTEDIQKRLNECNTQ